VRQQRWIVHLLDSGMLFEELRHYHCVFARSPNSHLQRLQPTIHQKCGIGTHSGASQAAELPVS
jgi:hypothetical protein